MDQKLSVIFIDDDDLMHGTYKLLLDRWDLSSSLNVSFCTHPNQAEQIIKGLNEEFCLAFLDHHFKDELNQVIAVGSEYIGSFKESNSHAEVIMISGNDCPHITDKWIENGADKVIYKGEDKTESYLKTYIELGIKKLNYSKRDTAKTMSSRFNVPDSLRSLNIISVSEEMEEVANTVSTVSRSNLPILILGETGTGKELVAQGIHKQSGRSGKFVAFNCANFVNTDATMKTELFGVVSGYATDVSARAGKFEEAHGGTIFLDEIHHLPIEIQISLLRLLQERKVRRLGSQLDKPLDIRLVCAGQPSFLSKIGVDDGVMEDFYYRINGVTLTLPPLSQRREDIELLSWHFLTKFNEENSCNKEFSPGAVDLLRKHIWEGNVRELMTCIEKLVVLSADRKITEKDVLKQLSQDISRVVDIHSLQERQKEEKKQALIKLYEESGCVRAKAAKKLGMARSSFNYLITSYDLDLYFKSLKAKKKETIATSAN